MRRNCIIPPKDMGDEYSLHEHVCFAYHLILTVKVVTTIACQAHLNSHIDKPILWEFDHAMQLYPLPDVVCVGPLFLPKFQVILADHYEYYEQTFHNCLFLNPGAFNIDTSFVQYDVKTGKADFLTAAVGGDS